MQVATAASKDDAGTRSIAKICRWGSTDADGPAQRLSTGQLYYQPYYLSIHETDPATSAAWTEAGVNAAQFGLKVVA